MKQYRWKKILTNVLWVLLAVATIVLLGAAMQQKSRKPCTDIRVEITGADKHVFIDENDVLAMLDAAGARLGTSIKQIQLRALEAMVEGNPWVANAEMYLDNKQILEIKITEREPVARVFTQDGYSFYIDSAAFRLPLSDKLTARVPAFTGFPTGKEMLAAPDSALLRDVVKIGMYILADSFWMAQVAQVDITPEAKFEIVPVIGDHIVALGRADDIPHKLNKLYTFYKKAWIQNGINTYERLDLQYANQLVAIKKGTARARVDSAKAQAIMNGLVSNPIVIPDSTQKVNVAPMPVVKTAAGATKSTAVPASTTRSQAALPEKTKTVTIKDNKTNKKTLSIKAKENPATKTSKDTQKQQPKAVLKKAGR